VADLFEIVFDSKQEEGRSINIEEGQKYRSDDTTQLANQKIYFPTKTQCGYMPNFILLGHVLHA
jgi:hypothetical protein